MNNDLLDRVYKCIPSYWRQPPKRMETAFRRLVKWLRSANLCEVQAMLCSEGRDDKETLRRALVRSVDGQRIPIGRHPLRAWLACMLTHFVYDLNVLTGDSVLEAVIVVSDNGEANLKGTLHTSFDRMLCFALSVLVDESTLQDILQNALQWQIKRIYVESMDPEVYRSYDVVLRSQEKIPVVDDLTEELRGIAWQAYGRACAISGYDRFASFEMILTFAESGIVNQTVNLFREYTDHRPVRHTWRLDSLV